MMQGMLTGHDRRAWHRPMLLAALLVVISLPPAASSGFGADEPGDQALWDYRTIYVVWDGSTQDWRADWTEGPSTVGLEAVLDGEGAEGWELVGMVHERFDVAAGQQTTQQLRLVFKRLLRDEGSALDQTVSVRDFSFQPGSLEIAVGTTVTWENQDAAPHTATSGTGAFDTGTIATGASSSVTFDQPGTFLYGCAIHPQMTGTIVVS